jgi:hypothetical protein
VFELCFLPWRKSTDGTDSAQLAMFGLGLVDENFEIMEEFADLVPLKGST